MNIVNEYANLFAGNMDAYGTEDGGCLRVPGGGFSDYRQRVADHLDGSVPFGVYPSWVNSAGETVCRWGCVDFDEGDDDSRIHAHNTTRVLAEFGATAFTEISRSKGFHVWLFAQRETPSSLMRQALLAVCDLASAPSREVNPKQNKLVDGKLGNYVRLPYPYGWRDRGRRCMVDDAWHPLSLESFVRRAAPNRVSIRTLETVASFWREPEPPRIERVPRYDSAPSNVYPGLIVHMIANGPLDGQDRSSWLWRMCRIMYEKQMPYADAKAALTEADSRWGKFHERSDGEHVLDLMLSKAWGAR